MPLAAIPLFGRFAACLALTGLLLAPATAEEQLTTDYKEIPRFDGGWDVYLKYWDGDVSDYSVSFVFSGDRFQQVAINPIRRDPMLVEAHWRILSSSPGKIQWEAVGQDKSDVMPAYSLFLSADVALTEWGPGKQHIIMVRTPCDFRHSDTASPEIEGCGWLPVTGEWLQAAHLNGDCSLTLRCYRLVSNMYKRLFP